MPINPSGNFRAGGNGNSGKLTGRKGAGWALFLCIWVIAGLLAIPTGIFCIAARPGDTTTDVLGLVLAILAGPLYWIYYFMRGGYCARRV